MGLIVKVQDDNGGFRAVPMMVALPIFFGLVSLIGGTVTWSVSAAHERSAILDIVRTEIRLSVAADDAQTLQRFISIESTLADLNDRLKTLERQVNINTGRLETMGVAGRERR